MTRIDAIIDEIRKELDKRPALLDISGLSALHHFKGKTRAPAAVVVKPEYKSRVEQRHKGGVGENGGQLNTVFVPAEIGEARHPPSPEGVRLSSFAGVHSPHTLRVRTSSPVY